MAGKCGHAGVAGGETGALIGAAGRDSRLMAISQLFTCLQLWWGECVRRVEITCFHVRLCIFFTFACAFT